MKVEGRRLMAKDASQVGRGGFPRVDKKRYPARIIYWRGQTREENKF